MADHEGLSPETEARVLAAVEANRGAPEATKVLRAWAEKEGLDGADAEAFIAAAADAVADTLCVLSEVDPEVVAEALGWETVGVEGVPWDNAGGMFPGETAGEGWAETITDEGERCVYAPDALVALRSADPTTSAEDLIPETVRPLFSPRRGET